LLQVFNQERIPKKIMALRQASIRESSEPSTAMGASSRITGAFPDQYEAGAMLVFAADENACPMRTDFFRVPFSRRHSKDFSSAICNRLIALRNNEDTVEHQSSNVVVVHVLGIASRSKLGFKGVLMH
jgi:hypothetical protein